MYYEYSNHKIKKKSTSLLASFQKWPAEEDIINKQQVHAFVMTYVAEMYSLVESP